MLLIPAIDIIMGRCVRLTQGDYQQVQHYGDDVIQVAQDWVNAGAKRLHLVDLEGAKAGSPQNQHTIFELVRHFPDIEFQVGGGIRTQATIERYLEHGVHYVVVGSIAYHNPMFVLRQIAHWPHRLILGLDVHHGSVRIGGWLNDTGSSALQMLEPFHDSALAGIIHTDISRDGLLNGANFADSAELALACSFPVFASGGVAGMEDIKQLHYYRNTLAGVIVGKALYEKRIDFSVATAYLQKQRT